MKPKIDWQPLFGEALEIYGREAAKEAIEERLREALYDLPNR